ncbi:MAG: hypothetical protein WAU07_05015 [Microgenomates group bacterium]
MNDEIDIRIIGATEPVRRQSRRRPQIVVQEGPQQSGLLAAEQVEWKLASEIASRFPRGQIGASESLDRANLQNQINLGDVIETFIRESDIPAQYHQGIREKLLTLYLGAGQVPEWVHNFSLLAMLADASIIENIPTSPQRLAQTEQRRPRTKAQKLKRAILFVLIGWLSIADFGLFTGKGPATFVRETLGRAVEGSDDAEDGENATLDPNLGITLNSQPIEVNNHHFWPLIADLSAGGSEWRIGGETPPRLVPPEDGIGSYVLQFGEITNNDESWLEFTSDINGRFLFEARTSSEEDNDVLIVERNGEEMLRLSGLDTEWKRYPITVNVGDTIKIVYDKDWASYDGRDAAELRNLSLVPFDDSPHTELQTNESSTDQNADSLDVSPFYEEVKGPLGNFEVGGHVLPIIREDLITSFNTSPIEFSRLGPLQISYLSLEAEASGQLTAWIYTSTEANYDNLLIVVNGTTVKQYSGEQGEWNELSIFVSQGDRITFQYQKDGDTTAGADAVWVADISLTAESESETEPGLAEVDQPTSTIVSTEAAENHDQSVTLTAEEVTAIADLQSLVAGPLKIDRMAGDANPQLTHLEEEAVDAIEFSGISENQSSSLFFTATGDGLFSMIGKTDSEFKQDSLLILINGANVSEISGQHVNWIDVKHVVASGDEIELRFINDSSISVGENLAWARNFEILPLKFTFAEGESQHTLVLSSSDNAILPFRQTVESFTGGSAYEFMGSQSQESATMSLVAPITGTMTYIWKANTSSQTGAVSVYIDGNLVDGIRGFTTWQKVTMSVTAGDEIFFTYQIDETASQAGQSNEFDNNDRAWIDSIEFGY